jgi:hypothetical protein
MGNTTRALALVTATVLLVSVAGCAARDPVSDDLTVDQAKQVTLGIEDDIAALIPAQNVTKKEQRSTGTLLSCAPDRGYQWTGRTKVFLHGDPDIGAIIDSIVDAYADKDGFASKRTKDITGEPQAEVRGVDGSIFIASPWEEDSRIEIASGSPCFRLPEDQYAGDEY